MRTNINLDKKSIITLVALAEGIKTSRSGTGIADLLDLATRLNGLAKACDDNCTVTVAASVNGCWFEYPNTNALVTKAGLKVEAEANRLVSATMHLVEDLYTGHSVGQVVIGGFPDTSDTDGDTNEGGDTEVFDGYKDVTRPLAIRKYVGSVNVPTGNDGKIPKYFGSITTDRMPTGVCDGTMLINGKLAKKLV
jgi:hypothetical protein